MKNKCSPLSAAFQTVGGGYSRRRPKIVALNDADQPKKPAFIDSLSPGTKIAFLGFVLFTACSFALSGIGEKLQSVKENTSNTAILLKTLVQLKKSEIMIETKHNLENHLRYLETRDQLTKIEGNLSNIADKIAPLGPESLPQHQNDGPTPCP